MTAAVQGPTTGRRWLPGLLNVGLALVVAAGAAYWIVALHNASDDARLVGRRLAMLRADAFEALALQERALLNPGADDEAATEVANVLRRGESNLRGIHERHDYDDVHADDAFEAFAGAVAAQLEALTAGDVERARIEAAEVAPAFVTLEDAIDEEIRQHDEEAEEAGAAADAGTVVALVLAALVVSGLSTHQRRSRRTAERRAAERASLELSEQRFRSLIQRGSDVISIIQADLSIAYVSPSIERVLGHQPRDVERDGFDLVHPDDVEEVAERLRALASDRSGSSVVLSFRARHRDGSWRHMETVAANLIDEPTVAGLVLNSRDVSERTALEHTLTHRALHDPLTDLANRALFHDRVEHALARGGRNGEHTAVALLDVDNFKAVNDSFGHAAGDEVLMTLATRLRECVRSGDTVARLGGDEFAVVLEATVEIEALAIAELMLDALRHPVTVGGRPIVMQASVGVASSRDASEATALVRNADLAMYDAKGRGKGRIEVFHPGMHEAVQARLELESDLRQALEGALADEQLRLHYQPKVALATGRVTGIEALVRWEHPGRGMVSPGDFIPLAEEIGLIVPIGEWVLDTACRQLAEWQAASPDWSSLVTSVNVSSRQFADARLVATVARVLAATGVSPGCLCLEVTESAVMTDVARATATLRRLKDLGVQISIDDFGTGYSSLSYLKQFPLDELKIDKRFVDGLGEDAEDHAIVAAVMGMADALALSVVAEGVETEEQVVQLQALGCGVAQGFFFARPTPAAEITELLRAGGMLGSTSVRGAGQRPTVLVVDDAPEVRAISRISLASAGFDVHEADSAAAALALVPSVRPDCIVADLDMPGMSGFELCRALRGDAATSDIAVVILSAASTADVKAQAFSLEVEDYIVKPVLPRELVSRITTALARRQQARIGAVARR